MSQRINALLTAKNMDTGVGNFTICIQQAAWNALLKMNESAKHQNCSRTAQQTILEKRKLKETWVLTRASQHKERLNRLCRNLKGLLNNEINQSIQ